MKKAALPLLCTCLVLAATPFPAAGSDLAELVEDPPVVHSPAPAAVSASARFNKLNTAIRDGKIARQAAEKELGRLLVEVAEEYYRLGGKSFSAETWRFPLAGYDSRAIGGGKGRGYLAGGYDYFSGNRHGGHPSYDIFIRDRDQDGRDDRSGLPVAVISMTGGIVVAMEREWQPGSTLRGGKYIWVYDPASDLLLYYAHNSEVVVGLGDLVEPGSLLGYVGRSGYNAFRRRSPTHLHLTALRGNHGRPVPVRILPALENAMVTAVEEKP